MGPTDEFELEARRRGYRCIAGLDEAGRGPLAGPCRRSGGDPARSLPLRSVSKIPNKSPSLSGRDSTRLLSSGHVVSV